MTAIIDALRSLNPWWARQSIQKDNLIERDILQEILHTLKHRQIKDILGVRRSGKTTLLFLVIENLLKQGVASSKIFFLSFDEINLATAGFDEIEKAIAQIDIEPHYLFLDEAQEKKGWERWVKQLYDSGRFRQIFVSGSSASLLSKDIGTLLTGRHITTVVFPFSFREFLKANDWKNFQKNYLLAEKNKVLHYLNRYLKNGGFPEVIGKDDVSVNRILSNMYNDIISRDIATRYNISKEKIDLLAKFLLTNIANEYSYNRLAQNTGLNIETVERYIGYLEDAFLLSSLKVFSYKLKVQFKQNKKIYAVDTGIVNSAAFRFSEDIGKLYENAVFVELKRRDNEVFYWKGNGEVDFLIREGLKVKELMQVCKDLSGQRTKERKIRALVTAAKAFKLKKAKIITDDLFAHETVDRINISYIPLWFWLLNETAD